MGWHIADPMLFSMSFVLFGTLSANDIADVE